MLDNNNGSNNDDDVVDYRKDNSDYNDDDSDGDDDDDDDDNNKQSKRMFFFFFSLLLLKNASTTLFQHFFLFHFYKCVPADPHTIGGVCVARREREWDQNRWFPIQKPRDNTSLSRSPSSSLLSVRFRRHDLSLDSDSFTIFQCTTLACKHALAPRVFFCVLFW